MKRDPGQQHVVGGVMVLNFAPQGLQAPADEMDRGAPDQGKQPGPPGEQQLAPDKSSYNFV